MNSILYVLATMRIQVYINKFDKFIYTRDATQFI